VATITLLPFHDSYIAEWYAQDNFAGESCLNLSQFRQTGDNYRSLLKFRLDAIPGGCSIEKAELELTMYRNEVKDAIDITVQRLLSRWHEKSVNWDTQPLHSPEIAGKIRVDANTPMGALRMDLSGLVKGWHDGSIINNGLLLKGNEVENNLVAFYNSKHINGDEWPKLHISFVDGVLNAFDKEEIIIPSYPEVPVATSAPIALGPRALATFLIANCSDSCKLRARIQVGYGKCHCSTYYDVGEQISLKARGYPGEAVALSSWEAAEFARILLIGAGGEKVSIYARSKEL